MPATELVVGAARLLERVATEELLSAMVALLLMVWGCGWKYSRPDSEVWAWAQLDSSSTNGVGTSAMSCSLNRSCASSSLPINARSASLERNPDMV